MCLHCQVAMQNFRLELPSEAPGSEPLIWVTDTLGLFSAPAALNCLLCHYLKKKINHIQGMSIAYKPNLVIYTRGLVFTHGTSNASMQDLAGRVYEFSFLMLIAKLF